MTAYLAAAACVAKLAGWFADRLPAAAPLSLEGPSHE
jgi:hypothetical protein